MSFSNTTEKTRNLIGVLAALPLTAMVLVAVYGSVGLLG